MLKVQHLRTTMPGLDTYYLQMEFLPIMADFIYFIWGLVKPPGYYNSFKGFQDE